VEIVINTNDINLIGRLKPKELFISINNKTVDTPINKYVKTTSQIPPVVYIHVLIVEKCLPPYNIAPTNIVGNNTPNVKIIFFTYGYLKAPNEWKVMKSKYSPEIVINKRRIEMKIYRKYINYILLCLIDL
jgi:hypothetical protein